MKNTKLVSISFLLFSVIFISFSCTSSYSNKKEESPKTWKYFNILAASEDDIIFSQLQDDLGIHPKMERYIITVNLLNKNDQYILIGGEQNSTAKKFPWSIVRASVQKGLLNWTGSTKEKLGE
jgi:hypothetical protein